MDKLPELTDVQFSDKIAEHTQLSENTDYDGTIHPNFEAYADKLAEAKIQMAPYQQFVKRFLSQSTPYKSLLLFHGVGTGKTCTAISVCEDFRVQSLNVKNGLDTIFIYIVCPKALHDNFRKQLFDKKKLVKKYHEWEIEDSCAPSLLPKREASASSSYESLVEQIEHTIEEVYSFFDYAEFAEQIKRVSDATFSSGLIVIDEIQNLRANEPVQRDLLHFIETTNVKIRLLFLSATPIYDAPSEIVWILNLMLLNDKRGKVEGKDIFDAQGRFVVPLGKKLFMQKATGYISFVRGENPYTFPYRIYPKVFAPEHSFARRPSYPCKPFDNKGPELCRHRPIFPLFLLPLRKCSCAAAASSCQSCIYDAHQAHGNLELCIQALIISYPFCTEQVAHCTGKQGLQRTMYSLDKRDYAYREPILNKYGRIFSKPIIGLFSAKIKHVLDSLYQTSNQTLFCEGIVLIYSRFLDGGLIPMALALEEEGFQRFGAAADLFRTRPPLAPQHTHTYAMITSDKRLSPNNEAEIAAITDIKNIHGDRVKVVLISADSSEGFNFSFIRQVHVLEPYKSIQRIEQIIGRAVRQFSHKELPFAKRNVQIFLYAAVTTTDDNDNDGGGGGGENNKESADLFLYRTAETHAKRIGKVTRAMKECAVDCTLHHDQTNFTQERIKLIRSHPFRQELSSGQVLSDFYIGDAPFSSACDYMKDCNYHCASKTSRLKPHAIPNFHEIKKRIRQLMREQYIYKRHPFIHMIQAPKAFPYEDICKTLDELIQNPKEIIYDMLGNKGNLAKLLNFYYFVPIHS